MKIALIGYGKMGKTIENIALQRGHTIELIITSQNKDTLTPENLSRCNVAIEFTNPHSAVNNIKACFNAGIPVACGSTGWLDDWGAINNQCKEKNGTLLYASNFSIGVNIFFEVNKKLAQLMKNQEQYEVSIEEIHHTQKKDAPSGTAITLAEQILQEMPRKKNWINDIADKKEALSIISKREDPAPGTHSIKYYSEIDTIEIVHTAHNREGFARGAVIAAEYIYGKKGIFSMKEVLDL